ncbi:hypothetical protein TNCV_4401871 [Trichonephila clavipes]|nr:hypothetical protein TNCV_4401871 [Trichonephila clavipes]
MGGCRRKRPTYGADDTHLIARLPVMTVHVQHGGTLSIRQTESPLERLEEGEERWCILDDPQSFLPQNRGGRDTKSVVTCMMLKAATDRREKLNPCHNEFRRS